MAENDIKLLAYQISELIKKYDEICCDFEKLVDTMNKRLNTAENRLAWIYGLLAGLGVVSIANLIKLFL